MRWRNLLIALLLVSSAAGWWEAWRAKARLKEAEFSQRRLAFIEAENRRISESFAREQRIRLDAEEARQRTEIEKSVATLRRLPFLQPVAYREMPRSELPKVLRQKLFQQAPDHLLEDSGVALKALGLLPAGTDLEKTYLGLLGEQIGAFYDQHTREVFTFSGQSLANAQNRVILAHELTHALEDQHFHLANLPLEAKGNDDRALAASALVEGDATLVMNQYLLGNLSGAAVRDSLTGVFTTDVRQLAAAPRLLRETLLFPYLKGQIFCQGLYDRGGWPALAEAFRHPPSSTAQILHPERYLADPNQDPVSIGFGAVEVLGQKPLVDNVLGELGTGQLLKVWSKAENSAELAAGWAGDRYLVYGDAKVNSYLWRSVWSTETGAERFAAAAQAGWQTRYKIAPAAAPVEGVDRAGVGPTMLSVRLPGGRELRIFRKQTEVTLLEAQDASWAEALTPLMAASSGRNVVSYESPR